MIWIQLFLLIDKIRCFQKDKNNKNMNKTYRSITNQQTQQLCAYNIRIINVKMKVKFICKMKIEHDTQSITIQVPVIDGSNFIFNQDCMLVPKNKMDDCFVLNVSLITNKGAKYIAGLAYIYRQQLARAVGEGDNSKIFIRFTKCLDAEAGMEIVVKQAVIYEMKRNSPPPREQSRYKRNKTHAYPKLNDFNIGPITNERSPAYVSPRGQINFFQNSTTKSQINLNRALPRPYDSAGYKQHTLKGNRRRTKTKDIDTQSHKFMKIGDELHGNNFKSLLTDRDRMTIDIVNDRSIQKGSVYKQSHSRLKQKYKKQKRHTIQQNQRRVNVQQTDPTVKIQALKLRLKCQQLQKNVTDKTGNINKLHGRIQELQRLIRGSQSVQNSMNLVKMNHEVSAINLYPPQYIQYQAQPQKLSKANNQSVISLLEQKVVLANKQLEQLKDKATKINKTHTQKQILLDKQLQKKNQKILKLQQQISNIQNSKITSTKNQQFFKLTLENKQNIIQRLEKEQDANLLKIAEMQKNNKNIQKNLEQIGKKAEEFRKKLDVVQIDKQKAVEELQGQKNKINMLQFTVSCLRKSQQKLQNQFQVVQKFKQKYHDSLLQIKKLQGQRKLQQKSFEATIKLTNNNINAQQRKYKQQLQMLHRKVIQLQSKSTHQIIKIKQLETYANTTAKNQIQNYRKLIEKLQKDCEQYRNNQRTVKKQLSTAQNKNSQIISQVEVWKNKFKSLQNVYKLESQKFRNQLARLKSTLEQQIVNQLALKQKNQNLTTELSVTTNKLLLLQQKYTKQNKQLLGKLQVENIKNNKILAVIKKQQEINADNKEKQKQLVNKIQQFGQNQSQYSDLFKRYEHQLNKVKTALATTEEKLNTKILQAQQLSSKLSQTSQKYTNNCQKTQQLTYQLKNATNQLQKQSKYKQKLQIQLCNLKTINQNKQKTIQRQKNDIEQQKKTKQQLKQELSKVNINLQSCIKENQRFKEQVYDILIRQFTGIDGLDSYGNFVFKSKMTLKQQMTKNTLQVQKPGSYSLKNSSRIYNINQQSLAKSIKIIQYPIPPSSPTSITPKDIITTINYYAKQSKNLLNRIIQQYRTLQKQFQYCRQTSAQKQAKFNQQTLKNQQNIRNFQQQISRINNQKQTFDKNNIEFIHTLQQQNFKYKTQLQKLQQKLEQLTYTCNGVKMEKQTEQQFYQSKIKQFTISNSKLQGNLNNLITQFQKEQENNQKLKSQNEKLQQQLRKSKQEVQSKQKKIKNLQTDLNNYTKFYENSNSKNKALILQVSQLQLLLSNQRQKNGKNLQLINQQQKKLVDTKDFINSLIKQKQSIVKQQIVNSHKIIQLQSAKISLQIQIQNMHSNYLIKINQLQSEKQNNRKSVINIRELENEVKKLRDENKKIGEELKICQKENYLLSENMKIKEMQYKKEIHNKNMEISQLKESKQLAEKITGQEKANLKKQINNLEDNVVHQLQQQVKNTRDALLDTQKQLQKMVKNMQQKTYEVNSYRQLYERINIIKQKQQDTIKNLNQQLQQKQQQLYNVSAQLYILQQKYHETLMAHKLQKQNIQQQFQYKYDNICQDYETRIDQLQRQRDYIKQKLVLAEQQLTKKTNRIKQLQQQQNHDRTISKTMLNQIQQQKNVMINNIKLQLKRTIDIKDRIQASNKKYQLQIQKLKSTEQTDKNLIKKLQEKIQQLQKIIQQKQSQTFSQIQNDRKKQIFIKQYQQNIMNYQWTLEREIKKQLQNVVKAIISNSSSQNQDDKRKIMDVVKDVESRISRLINQRIIGSNGNNGNNRFNF